MTGPTGRRPIKLAAIWTPIAGLLAVWCLILTIVGFGWFQIAAGGYGGTKEKVIGVGVLLIGLLLFFFRRIVQDKERIHWREDTPTMPEDAAVGSSRLRITLDRRSPRAGPRRSAQSTHEQRRATAP